MSLTEDARNDKDVKNLYGSSNDDLDASNGLEKLSVTETVTIDAPAKDVWDEAVSFDGLDSWIPGITKNELVSGVPNEADAVRKLYVDDASLTEELMDLDDKTMTLKYRIIKDNVDLLPVTHYNSTISAASEGDNASEITWSGEFYRGFPESNPPDYLSDEAAVKGVTGLYQAGLGNLKKELEGK
ncbi:SRPBCC family protein [Grimontia sp. NTOU-MAR1]|uniref:SRPBCC family protein n=1 Tax=Grimontia sp. NTOU-MAR1 TaxID=3111011 RepID=UPI002DC05077|nr:SRPBCC family protein [Grimontia sp. NTOU-MAR1]WRW01017.1 SRPBCC family protein [Grimontia sp. NTOU-MAR1]